MARVQLRRHSLSVVLKVSLHLSGCQECTLGIDTLCFLFCLLCYSLIPKYMPIMLQKIPIIPRKVPIILIVILIIQNSWQPLGGLSHSVIKQTY